ncbi:MAG: 23S rRNA (pseudouridine(1915)-N(3))-methyltransferase RlmH [Methanobacteriota archaeon]
MQIHLVAIGKVKELYLRDGIDEYLRRLSGFCSLKVTEYPESRMKDNPSLSEITTACQQEGVKLLKAVDSSGLLIALDPRGFSLSSEDFAKKLQKWEIEGPHKIAILIGGPHGLSDEVRNRADLLISLSSMTFPHQLVRLILLEQIYRVYTINKGLPYHR